MKKLLYFNLEIALKEPERVVFADGTKVEDWYYFRGANSTYPIVVHGKNKIVRYTIKGRYLDDEVDTELDLKLLPKTKTWHFCVYRQPSGHLLTSTAFESKEEMLELMKGAPIFQEYTYTEEIL